MAHGAHVAGKLCCDGGVFALQFVQADDDPALLDREVAVRVLVTFEQRGRRRGRGGRR